MKIAMEKQIAFLERIIKDTKSGAVYWDSLLSTSQIVAVTFPFMVFDPEGAFRCGFRGKADGIFIIALCDTGEVVGAVGTNYDQMVHLDYNREKISVLLTRLFNLICEHRPSANKFIDEYLAFDLDEDADQ